MGRMGTTEAVVPGVADLGGECRQEPSRDCWHVPQQHLEPPGAEYGELAVHLGGDGGRPWRRVEERQLSEVVTGSERSGRCAVAVDVRLPGEKDEERLHWLVLPESPRRCRRRSGRGVHQLNRPASAMSASVRVALTTKASITTANARPMPNILTTATPDVAMATKTIVRMTAAAVTMPPVRCRPRTMAVLLEPDRSYSSFMRASTKTS